MGSPLTITVPPAPLLVKVSGTLGISGISVTDLLSYTYYDSLNLTVAHGTITLSTTVTGGIANYQVYGNGTGNVSIYAPFAAIDATLAAAGGLTYTPITGYSGLDTLALAASDGSGNGATGSVTLLVGGPLAIGALVGAASRDGWRNIGCQRHCALRSAAAHSR